MCNAQVSQKMIDQMCRLNSLGINQGVSGNLSVRHNNSMIITPTGIAYEVMNADDMVTMSFEEEYGCWRGKRKPSSEWRIHYDILSHRTDVNCVIHTHANFCTVLSIAHKKIPACHYMISTFGGNDVRCADYATYGTKSLSQNVLFALENRMACLMANHGAIALGKNLEEAIWRMIELETIAKQYYYSLMLNDAVMLTDAEIEAVFKQQSKQAYGLKSVNENN